jgi:peptidoglycan hydrolase-like protein with peptidoglycan-binding domain
LIAVGALVAVAAACSDESFGNEAENRERTAADATTTSADPPTTIATTTTTTTTPAPPPPPEPEVLRRGAEGPIVVLVQHRLEELGFRPGSVDGHYGDATYAAVMAFQKHEGLDPDGHTGPITIAALQQGLLGAGPRGGPTPRIEIDIARQIAFVVAADGTTKIINVSSGNGERYTHPEGGTRVAETPRGNFTVRSRIDGVRVAPLGNLYRPLYFKGGFAIHGSSNVPGYPASHGCVRTTNPDQDYLYDLLPNGGTVHIYPD